MHLSTIPQILTVGLAVLVPVGQAQTKTVSYARPSAPTKLGISNARRPSATAWTATSTGHPVPVRNSTITILGPWNATFTSFPPGAARTGLSNWTTARWDNSTTRTTTTTGDWTSTQTLTTLATTTVRMNPSPTPYPFRCKMEWCDHHGKQSDRDRCAEAAQKKCAERWELAKKKNAEWERTVNHGEGLGGSRKSPIKMTPEQLKKFLEDEDIYGNGDPIG